MARKLVREGYFNCKPSVFTSLEICAIISLTGEASGHDGEAFIGDRKGKSHHGFHADRSSGKYCA